MILFQKRIKRLKLKKLSNTTDIKKKIKILLSKSEYENCFSTVLGNQDLALLNWFIEQIDLDSIYALNQILKPLIILSLLQQLTYIIDSNVSQKLDWVICCLDNIDYNHESVAQYFKGVLQGLQESLSGLGKDVRDDPAIKSQIKTINHNVDKILNHLEE